MPGTIDDISEAGRTGVDFLSYVDGVDNGWLYLVMFILSLLALWGFRREGKATAQIDSLIREKDAQISTYREMLEYERHERQRIEQRHRETVERLDKNHREGMSRMGAQLDETRLRAEKAVELHMECEREKRLFLSNAFENTDPESLSRVLRGEKDD